MGFGGGGSGSFVLPNHDHTNVLADGGELLEATSLIDGITLAAWIAANANGWRELYNSATMDTGVAGIAEYEELMVIIVGTVETNGTNVDFIFNGDTGTNYNYTYSIDGAAYVTASSTFALLGIGRNPQLAGNYVCFIRNTGAEKLYQSEGLNSLVAAVGNYPEHNQEFGKWINASGITDIQCRGITTGRLIILGKVAV